MGFGLSGDLARAAWVVRWGMKVAALVLGFVVGLLFCLLLLLLGGS